MIKLAHILFESVDKGTIVHELSIALESHSSLTRTIMDEADSPAWFSHEKELTHEEVAQLIYNQSAKAWDNILRNAQTFKFLGGGSWGVAFDLGDKVLKLENAKDSDFSTKKRTGMANKALWGDKLKVQKDKGGISVPMVYDHGEFTVLGDIDIFWVINEKFERNIEGKSGEITSVENWYTLLGEIIDIINTEYEYLPSDVDVSKADKKTMQRLINPIINTIHTGSYETEDEDGIIHSESYEEASKPMEEDLRLAPDWLDEFVADMIKLRKKAKSGSFATDFHAGNLGIRRKGAEGYLKFFD